MVERRFGHTVSSKNTVRKALGVVVHMDLAVDRRRMIGRFVVVHNSAYYSVRRHHIVDLDIEDQGADYRDQLVPEGQLPLLAGDISKTLQFPFHFPSFELSYKWAASRTALRLVQVRCQAFHRILKPAVWEAVMAAALGAPAVLDTCWGSFPDKQEDNLTLFFTLETERRRTYW